MTSTSPSSSHLYQLYMERSKFTYQQQPQTQQPPPQQQQLQTHPHQQQQLLLQLHQQQQQQQQQQQHQHQYQQHYPHDPREPSPSPPQRQPHQHQYQQHDEPPQQPQHKPQQQPQQQPRSHQQQQQQQKQQSYHDDATWSTPTVQTPTNITSTATSKTTSLPSLDELECDIAALEQQLGMIPYQTHIHTSSSQQQQSLIDIIPTSRVYQTQPSKLTIYLDITNIDGRIGRLSITDGCSASQLAHTYVTYYSLHPSLIPPLAHIIQQRIRTYVQTVTGKEHQHISTHKSTSSSHKSTRSRSRIKTQSTKRLLLTT